jgi:hypothetical protein
MNTKTIVLYAPSLIFKIYIYPFVIASPIFLIYMANQLYTTLSSNDPIWIKIFFSYILTFALGAFTIIFYRGSSILTHFKYKITIDENNIITYKKYNQIVKQFTFFDIENITERGTHQEFIFNFRDGTQLPLPFDLKNYDLFFSLLFTNYKRIFSTEELNHTYTNKENILISIVVFIFFSPIIFLPLLASKYVILFYIIGAGTFFYFFDTSKYIKIIPESIEIKSNFKKVTISRNELETITFDRLEMNNSLHYSCIIMTKQGKKYKLTSSEISSIDLYCLLTFWQNNQ